MKTNRMLAFALSILLLANGRTAAGQEPDISEMPPPDDEILIVRLSHANAHEIKNTLNELPVGVISFPASDTQLVVTGPKARVERVKEELLPLLDVPDTHLAETRRPELIPIDPGIRKSVMTLVSTVTTDPQTRVAIDQSSGLLAVRGTERDVAAIRQLLKQIDRPRRGMAITLYFLRGRIGAQETSGQTALPKGLAPIAETLRTLGLTQLTTMAPMLVRVDEDQRFESSSTHRTTNESPAETLHYLVEGEALTKPGNDTVQVRLSAQMQGRVSGSGEDKNNVGFQIDTTIATKLGDYVLLSAGPSSTANGDAVALVLRVTAD